MRSVNVAELKNRLSKYLRFARGGEEVVIRDNNLPVAKLVPFSTEGADDQELMSMVAGKCVSPRSDLP
jgi:prevent-host-death family protein